MLQIIRQESADVIATEAERHLGQVVGAEGEEFAGIRHPVREQRGAGDFDHRAVLVIQLGEAELLKDF